MQIATSVRLGVSNSRTRAERTGSIAAHHDANWFRTGIPSRKTSHDVCQWGLSDASGTFCDRLGRHAVPFPNPREFPCGMHRSDRR
ncbi:hypothetical protein CERSUDRAFT_113771 [Gelatoporia subvermispora B]|uniref:Uncharacterized protein n=1 Tax=Ceriporiopsis subvermispora (strain B) TaxID=914234 RepID=M2QNG5_CERS8|nr:hypothetical protein CERSUDRAFT_113771 [Gelatoporia subvermispora B]